VKKLITAAVLGGASWTAAEYGLHRFAMHELRGKGMASREHLLHHADVTYFAPTSKKLLSAAATTTVVLPTSWKLTDRTTALTFTAGMIGTYFVYELIHRRAHTHPPTNAYGRWVRRSHLHHHFGSPMRNFGVTSPVWDKAFGTYDEPGIVTVPRRMAPEWMLDANGDVHPHLSADYVVKGRADRPVRQAESDRVDAFANVAPDPGGE